MYLSRFHRRALFGVATAGIIGGVAVPLWARLPGVAPAKPKPVAAARVSALMPYNSLSAMKAQLAEVLAAKRKLGKNRDADEREAKEHVIKSHQKMTIAEMREHVKDENDENEWGAWDAARIHFLMPRVYPNDILDPQQQLTAMQKAKQMAPAQFSAVSASNSGKSAGVRADAVITPTPVPAPVVPVPPIPVPPSTAQWEFYGPPGYSNGAVSWRVGGLAYDPNNLSTLYCAAPTGGIWRSTTSGASWTALTDSQIGLATSSVAVAPGNSQIILGGTGDFDGGAGSGYGILRSIDGGVTWNVTGAAQFGNQPIHKVIFDPFTAGRVFATGGYNGLFRSNDYGATWTMVVGPTAVGGSPAVPNGRWSNFDTNVTGEIYYATADDVGVFMSTDAGNTWIAMPGAPTGAGRYDVVASKIGSSDVAYTYGISTDPGQLTQRKFGDYPYNSSTKYQIDAALRAKRTLYVMQGGTGKTDGKIYKGEPPAGGPDKGDAAFRTLNNFPKSGSTGRPLWDQKNYNFYMGVSKTQVRVAKDTSVTPNLREHWEIRDVLVVGLVNQYASRDGGLLWQGAGGIHGDHHCITFNPTNPLNGAVEYLAGSDGGAYRGMLTSNTAISTTPVNTTKQVPSPVPDPVPDPPTDPNTVPSFLSVSYSSLNSGLGIAQFYTSAFHPTDTTQGVGGTQDNGDQITFSGTPGWYNFFGGDGGACGISQNNGGVQFVSDYTPKLIDPDADPFYQFAYTTDTWNFTGQVIPLNVSSDVMPFILAGDIGKANPNLPGSAGKATSNVMFAGTNYLYKFDINIGRWIKYPFQFSQTGYISAVTTSSTNPNYIYVGTIDGRVFYTSDNGVTWNNITSGLPNRSINRLQASDTNPNRLFVTVGGGGSGHVYRNNNIAGGGWTNISGFGNTGLPDINTSALAVVPSTNDVQMFVGTDVGVFYTKDSGSTWQNATSTLGLPNAIINNLSISLGQNYIYATTFGRGIWRLPLNVVIPTSAPVTISPQLQGYRGDKTKLSVSATFVSGNQTAFTRNGVLTPAGTFTTTLQNFSNSSVNPVKYDIYVTIPGFLRKKFAGVIVTSNTPTITGLFYNGDVNGDNMIDDTDAAIVTARLRPPGQRVIGLPDVDGDGIMSSNDLLIVQSNNPRKGD